MIVIRTVPTDELGAPLRAETRRLLDAAFGGDFSDDDWEHALGGRHVLVLEGRRLLAHASVVPRTLEVAGRPVRTGYVEAVATAPDRRGEGLASRAMRGIRAQIEADHDMGALSTDRHGFYERLGWERWRGPTFVRDGAALRRSADEDEGIMVLRVGPSRDVDLGAAIACAARPGDDW